MDVGKYIQEPQGKGEGKILCVGSLIERKGVDLLLQALAKVESDYSLYLAGDGAYLFENAVSVFGNVLFAEGNLIYPQGEAIAAASVNIAQVNAQDIKLSYLRLSQAERELKERNKK